MQADTPIGGYSYQRFIPPSRGYCLGEITTVELDMLSKYSPDTPGAIQRRLNDLRKRKAVLDELIACMERYQGYQVHRYGGRMASLAENQPRRLAGAA